MPQKELIDILVGYSSPDTLFVGVAPPGKNGMSHRVRSIVYFEAAIRSLSRHQSWGVGMRHFYPLFFTCVGTMKESWQSEIMRVMDKPTFGTGKRMRENLGARLFHEKFQSNALFSQVQKDEEQRLFNLLSDRYELDGYEFFRNRLGFHVDLEEAKKEPQIGGSLHEMTTLLLDWYRFIGTILYQGEPKSVTEGGPIAGRTMALQFKEMILVALFHRANRKRERAKKSLRRYGM